jgi:uracil-DNA glycosylase
MLMAMEEVNMQVYGCRKCRLWQGAKHGVPGEGPLNAEVMFVGQNPGAEEDESGRPFVGRAGKYLTKTLSEYGIKREDIYITNIVKHTSPQNRKPYSDEVDACLPYLIMQINIIKPKIIVLLGASAKGAPRVEGVEYFEVIHPSAAMRFTKMREKFRLQIADLAKKTASMKSKADK